MSILTVTEFLGLSREDKEQLTALSLRGVADAKPQEWLDLMQGLRICRNLSHLSLGELSVVSESSPVPGHRTVSGLETLTFPHRKQELLFVLCEQGLASQESTSQAAPPTIVDIEGTTSSYKLIADFQGSPCLFECEELFDSEGDLTEPNISPLDDEIGGETDSEHTMEWDFNGADDVMTRDEAPIPPPSPNLTPTVMDEWPTFFALDQGADDRDELGANRPLFRKNCGG